jgi:ferrous iron transport protein A
LLTDREEADAVSLWKAEEGREYIIQDISADDQEVEAFLFTLGCYAGEPITVVFRISGGCVVSIKDGRYSIDKNLAKAIIV